MSSLSVEGERVQSRLELHLRIINPRLVTWKNAVAIQSVLLPPDPLIVLTNPSLHFPSFPFGY